MRNLDVLFYKFNYFLIRKILPCNLKTILTLYKITLRKNLYRCIVIFQLLINVIPDFYIKSVKVIKSVLQEHTHTILLRLKFRKYIF